MAWRLGTQRSTGGSTAAGKAGDSKWVYVFRLREGRIVSYEQFNAPGLANAFR